MLDRLQIVGISAWHDLCGFPYSLAFGVGGQSHFNFLASTVLGRNTFPKSPSTNMTRTLGFYIGDD